MGTEASVGSRAIHPFPARMAPEIALDAIPAREGSRLTVIDPMCGSGTVLATALERGHNAVGTDIDPLAVMMSRLAVTPVDPIEMSSLAASVAAAAGVGEGSAPWGDDEETDRFVDFWFGPAQKRQLLALTTELAKVEDRDQRLALQMTLSRTIVTKSPRASLAADTAHSRPHRVLTESEYDVIKGFEKSAKQMARYLQHRSLAGNGEVSIDDARVLTSVADEYADLAVTSPPYLNALDYMRGHKLALVWFGHLISDLRATRAESIGSERGLADAAFDTVNRIVETIQDAATNPSALRTPMVRRYANDCVGFATQLHRTLKQGGRAVLVVGNSTLRGNYIENSLIARYAMEGAGFRLKEIREREIPPNRRYMAISASADSSITKRMRTEVILTMEKVSAAAGGTAA